jgi:hypothetical protein
MPQKPKINVKANLKIIRANLAPASLPFDQWQLPAPAVEFDLVSGVAKNFGYGPGKFYPQDAMDFCFTQVEMFKAEPNLYEPPVSIYTRDHELPFKYAELLDKESGRDLMIRPRWDRGRTGRYNIPKNYAPRIGIFGIGLGHHVNMLLDFYTTRTMLITETEPLVMASAIHGNDWEEIFAKARRKGVDLKILFHRHPVEAAYAAMNEMRKGAVSGNIGARFYGHHEVGTMAQTKKSFIEVLPLIAAAGGYFDDEFRQILQSRENLAFARIIARGTPSFSKDKIAVVVGSGPSLDPSIGVLRSIRDRVTLFSCGSASKPLIAAGLHPDFHVEIETHPSNIPIVAGGGDAAFFESTPLLCSTGTPKEMLELFRRYFIFPRSMSGSTTAFGNQVEEVKHAFARVGNAGLAIAIHLGFRTIVMLGMDSGYSKDEADHAKNSIYDTDTTTLRKAEDVIFEGIEKLEAQDQKQLRSARASAIIPIRAISGGELMADSIFAMAISAYLNLIRSRPDCDVYQVGNGAYLDGAINRTVMEFATDLPTLGISLTTDDVIAAATIRQDMLPIYLQNLDQISRKIEQFFKDMAKILSRKVRQPIDFIRIDEELTALLNGPPSAFEAHGTNWAEAVACGMQVGSVSAFCRAIVERAFLLPTLEDTVAYITLGQSILLRMIEEMRDRVVAEFKTPQESKRAS